MALAPRNRGRPRHTELARVRFDLPISTKNNLDWLREELGIAPENAVSIAIRRMVAGRNLNLPFEFLKRLIRFFNTAYSPDSMNDKQIFPQDRTFFQALASTALMLFERVPCGETRCAITVEVSS